MVTIRYLRCDFVNLRLCAMANKDRLKMAVKKGTSVLKILLGVGTSGGEGFEGLVEDADDPLLFGPRG